MRNAWYIASTSEELAGVILKRTILSEEIVLYRDTKGKAHALHDQCAHRGAALSNGKQKGDCISCPFHGWEFSGEGKCRYIPANGPAAPIPAGAHIRSYPVQEAAGYVWVFLGATEHLYELKLPAELLDSNWRGIPFGAEWNAHFTRVVESILDVSHLPFVHPETTGRNVNPVVEGPKFQVDKDEITIEAKPFHPLLQAPLTEMDTSKTSIIQFWFPNQIILRTDMHEANRMSTYLCFTPVNEEYTLIYGLALRNFFLTSELLDSIHYEHNVTVLEQDRPIIESLRPKASPLNLLAEQHVRSDSPQVRYRLMLRNALKKQLLFSSKS